MPGPFLAAEEDAAGKAAHAKVCRSFARLGFKQCSFGSSVWCLVPRFRPEQGVLPAAEVGDVPVTVIPTPKDPEELTGADSDLVSVLFGHGNDGDATAVATLASGLQRAVSAGGSVNNARIMHQLVANSGPTIAEGKVLALLPHLIRLGGNVNLADEVGLSTSQ